jgi:hypothetical protein
VAAVNTAAQKGHVVVNDAANALRS